MRNADAFVWGIDVFYCPQCIACYSLHCSLTGWGDVSGRERHASSSLFHTHHPSIYFCCDGVVRKQRSVGSSITAVRNVGFDSGTGNILCISKIMLFRKSSLPLSYSGYVFMEPILKWRHIDDIQCISKRGAVLRKCRLCKCYNYLSPRRDFQTAILTRRPNTNISE
jgi:hypothetical protein